MNKEEIEFEMEIRDNINNRVEKLEKLDKSIRGMLVEQVKEMLGIVKDTIKSNDPEILLLGLKHCTLLKEAMKSIEIKYEEIDLSEEEVRSLKNEIIQRLPVPEIPVVVVGEKERGKEGIPFDPTKS